MRAWIGNVPTYSNDNMRALRSAMGTACIPDPCEFFKKYECPCGEALNLIKALSNLQMALSCKDRDRNDAAVRAQHELLLETQGIDNWENDYCERLESPSHIMTGALKHCLGLIDNEYVRKAAEKMLKDYEDWQKQKFKGDDCPPPPKKETTPVYSRDPNDKYGYRSPSGSTYFKEDVTNMTYVINFENDPEKATAAAQDVYLTDTLDLSKFDINSFRAGYVRVGDKMKQAAYDEQNYTWDMDMRPKMNLITRVNLSLDKEKGIAQWHFASIDPMTDEPVTDVFAGFLPPDDETGRGQGSVSFTINLKDHLPDDTEVSNRAEIIFDYNEPILTPDWTNRKDVLPPVSRMLQPVELNDSIVSLQWDGKDSGSGVWNYNVYARSGDAGDWYLLNSNTEQTETEFAYTPNIRYGFYVEATDRAGNREMKNALPEVTFYKKVSDTGEVELFATALKLYPNPFSDPVHIENAEGCTLTVITEIGTVALVQKITNSNETIRLEHWPAGVYFFRFEKDGKAKTVKVVKMTNGAKVVKE